MHRATGFGTPSVRPPTRAPAGALRSRACGPGGLQLFQTGAHGRCSPNPSPRSCSTPSRMPPRRKRWPLPGGIILATRSWYPLYGRIAGHHRRRRLPRRRHDPEDHRAPPGPACIRRTWITWPPGCSSRASAVPLRFRSDLQVIILCSNWTRTRTDSAMSPMLPGLSMTRCSVRHPWDISAKRRRVVPQRRQPPGPSRAGHIPQVDLAGVGGSQDAAVRGECLSPENHVGGTGQRRYLGRPLRVRDVPQDWLVVEGDGGHGAPVRRDRRGGAAFELGQLLRVSGVGDVPYRVGAVLSKPMALTRMRRPGENASAVTPAASPGCQEVSFQAPKPMSTPSIKTTGATSAADRNCLNTSRRHVSWPGILASSHARARISSAVSAGVWLEVSSQSPSRGVSFRSTSSSWVMAQVP